MSAPLRNKPQQEFSYVRASLPPMSPGRCRPYADFPAPRLASYDIVAAPCRHSVSTP